MENTVPFVLPTKRDYYAENIQDTEKYHVVQICAEDFGKMMGGMSGAVFAKYAMMMIDNGLLYPQLTDMGSEYVNCAFLMWSFIRGGYYFFHELDWIEYVYLFQFMDYFASVN